MSSRLHNSGRVWPTAQQTLLLKAALVPHSLAADAFATWRSENDFRSLDYASLTVLPLLYRRLSDHDAARPTELKGVYQWAWSKNQLLFSALRGVLADLESAGVETMLLKGAALSVCCYQDRGARPMGDGDVLVPGSKIRTAIAVLRSRGWTPHVEPSAAILRSRHSLPFKDATGRQIDLHWRALMSSYGTQDDDAWWRGSRTIALDGVATRTMNHADQFLHALVHGLDMTRNIHWAADAVTIVRHAAHDLDWDRLIAHARDRQLAVPVRRGVQFLVSELGLQVPVDVVTRIEALPESRRERAEFWCRRRRGPSAPWGVLAGAWFSYQRYARAQPARTSLGGFARFVSDLQEYRRVGPRDVARWLSAPLKRAASR